MTVKSLASETTHYMTVRHDDDGTSKEYTRTAYGEWCETIATNSPDDLRRVNTKLAFQLEALFATL
jgi:hypothetical protein